MVALAEVVVDGVIEMGDTYGEMPIQVTAASREEDQMIAEADLTTGEIAMVKGPEVLAEEVEATEVTEVTEEIEEAVEAEVPADLKVEEECLAIAYPKTRTKPRTSSTKSSCDSSRRKESMSS